MVHHLVPPWAPPYTKAACLSSTPRAAEPCIPCLSCVTLGLLYYNEPHTLREHVANWASWPCDLRKRFEFVVVDDGSDETTTAAAHVFESSNTSIPENMGVRILRVLPPKRAWNIGGARNLLMSHASCCHALLNDLDYTLSPVLAEIVANAAEQQLEPQLQRREAVVASRKGNDFEGHWIEAPPLVHKPLRPPPSVFRFHRAAPAGLSPDDVKVWKCATPLTKPHASCGPLHPAIALLPVDLYWRAGGCDEDFVGHYGNTDAHFWHRLKQHDPRPRMTLNTSWPPLTTLSAAEACRTDASRCADAGIEGEGASSHWHQSEILGTRVLSRDAQHNYLLFRRKMAGQKPWSTSYLRFGFSEAMCMSLSGELPKGQRLVTCVAQLSSF